MWRRFFKWLLDDGLNHDWDGEWTDQDAAYVQEHLKEVERRAPIEDKLEAWSLWVVPAPKPQNPIHKPIDVSRLIERNVERKLL